MPKQNEIDWLGRHILAALKERGLAQSYIEDKRRELAGLDRLETIRWCIRLDRDNLSALADRLGITLPELATTVRTITRKL